MQRPEAQTTQARTVTQMLAAASRELAGAGVDTPRLDAEVLLAAACGIDRARLCARGAQAVPTAAAAVFRRSLKRRLLREPVAYIVGRREFWSLEFEVTPAVLVPRPETELLVEVTRDHVRALNASGIAGPLCDIGTGSGCIAVALATELPQAEIWAVDISAEALDVARRNARRHGVDERLHFVCSDLFERLPQQEFVGIVANPPYVAAQTLDGLEPELAYEPRVAVNGGGGGLSLIRSLICSSAPRLAPQGALLVEIGADQGEAARATALRAGFGRAEIRPDLAGHARVLVARR